MKAIMLGAPKPTRAPKMAKIRWLRAFGDPATKERAAITRPIMETRGKIVEMSLDCIVDSVDSTLQKPSSGRRTSPVTSNNGKIYFQYFMKFLNGENRSQIVE